MVIILAMSLLLRAVAADGVHVESVKRVHLVQANHLDLGFSDLMSRVMNRYLNGGPGTSDPDSGDQPCEYDSFLGSAARTATELRAAGEAPGFKYMADSWVLDVLRDCPTDFPTVGPRWDPTGLECPNASLTLAVHQAVKRGDIWMHSFPYNGQVELMDPAMFEAAVNGSCNTAAAMGSPHTPRVMSQRDVPGLTRAVVPHLRKRGVVGISVGSNDASPAPLTPSTVECSTQGLHVVRTPFLWEDAASGESIVVDIHPGGYGGITGDYNPPGDSMDGALCDCVGVDGLDEVLCYAWRGDNYGPAGPAEVRQDFALFDGLFPSAKVTASTLGAFFDLIDGNPQLRATLPRLGSEIGDTWMYGCASDPKKLAKMRAIQRAYTKCHDAGRCGPEAEPGIDTFLHYALKLFEHTWGGSTSHHMNVSRTEVERVWTAQELAAARTAGSFKFVEKMQATWTEQRLYIDKALSSLAAGSALAAAIGEEFGALTAAVPNAASLHAANYTAVPEKQWGRSVAMGRLTVAFDLPTGALIQLDSSSPAEGTGWASASNPIGRFGYKSHSWKEWDTYIRTYLYTHGGQHPHQPVPSSFLTCDQMNNCSTIAAMWRAPIVAMWTRPASRTAGASTVVQLALPVGVGAAGYGPPPAVFLTATELPEAEGILGLELAWDSKPATRLYEGVYFDVHPALATRAQPQPDSRRVRAQSQSEGWKLLVDKIGSKVDVSDVVTGGGSAVHGMDPNGGVTFLSPDLRARPSLHIGSYDAGLVLPAKAQTVINFTAFYDRPADPADGVSFNLMNNLYWTNYVLWYPWLSEDAAARFRFKISVH